MQNKTEYEIKRLSELNHSLVEQAVALFVMASISSMKRLYLRIRLCCGSCLLLPLIIIWFLSV